MNAPFALYEHFLNASTADIGVPLTEEQLYGHIRVLDLISFHILLSGLNWSPIGDALQFLMETTHPQLSYEVILVHPHIKA